jgi:predicted MPP superfamily phosphohydrolase
MSDDASHWDRFWDDTHRRLTRRRWPAALARWLPVATDLDIDRHDIAVPGMARDCRLTIAFASDFHAGPTTPARLLDAAVERLTEAQPDVLLLGGDFVSVRAADARALVAGLATIPAPLGRFAVLGNHDHTAGGPGMSALLEGAGIEMLTNRSVRLPAPFDAIALCGLDDHVRGAPDAAAAFEDAAPVRIVLMHGPAGLLDIGERPFAVAFCGHTHGGQVALPNGWPLLTACGPLARRYSAGRYDLAGGRTLLVSRGVGYTALPFRLNAPAEITVCTIAPSRGVSSSPFSSSASDRATR